jgi:formiminoglutamase
MSWQSIADLIADDTDAPVAILGAPMEAGSVTPGRCDLAPAAIRKALRRFSTWDLTCGLRLDLAIRDAGDVPVQGIMPADAFLPIRDAVEACVREHALTLLLGGNNAVTRPAAHGLGLPLEQVGLITFDAHFDMRDTAGGPMNGNPVRCLIEDGLPGANIVQIGLAPFANTFEMSELAKAEGVGVYDVEGIGEGIVGIVDAAMARLDRAGVEAVMIDFDIDVIDRAQCPGAPGARPGGLPVRDFFRAARHALSFPRVRLVDLTEFDPSLDVSDITSLTAGRWVCEVLAGYSSR